MSELGKKYSQEIEEILAKYPPEHKQSAVMPLLFLAQREDGYIRDEALTEIGDILEMDRTEVASLVGFYTLYYDEKEGQYRIQVCTDVACALRGADEFLERLCEALDIQPGETTADGLVTVEEVMCLAACDKAPMFQVQTREEITYHENQTVESALDLVQSWRDEEEQGEDS